MSLSLEEEQQQNRLSLCDIIMPNVYIRSLVIYDYHIDDLEEPLNEFLDLYCPQAFQCIVYDKNSAIDGYIVDCEDEQKRKVFSREARMNESISKYLDDNASIDELFPYGLFPIDSYPLIFIHQIYFKDGTILSFGCHHYLSDGHGFSLLGQRFSKWLKEKRSLLFDHDRSKLRQITASSSSIKFDHLEMTIIEPIYSPLHFVSTNKVVKRYTKEYLFEKLQIKNTNENISMNDVLVGWLTQIISQIRQLPLESTIKVGIALNGRKFLPTIDENYFGNCSFYICFSFSMFDLNNLTVNELSQRINIEKRKFMTREYIQSALAFIDKYHRTSTIHLGWQPSGGVDLSFTNWSKFPLYQCDFGQGGAKSFKIPSLQSNGLIFILPTSNKDEIELHITLKTEHAQLILNKLV